jgi:hypothetical protein
MIRSHINVIEDSGQLHHIDVSLCDTCPRLIGNGSDQEQRGDQPPDNTIDGYQTDGIDGFFELADGRTTGTVIGLNRETAAGFVLDIMNCETRHGSDVRVCPALGKSTVVANVGIVYSKATTDIVAIKPTTVQVTAAESDGMPAEATYISVD